MDIILICGLLGLIELFLVLKNYIKKKNVDKWELIIGIALTVMLIKYIFNKL